MEYVEAGMSSYTTIFRIHDIYKPLQLQGSLQPDALDVLRLTNRLDQLNVRQIIVDAAKAQSMPEQTSGKIINSSS